MNSEHTIGPDDGDAFDEAEYDDRECRGVPLDEIKPIEAGLLQYANVVTINSALQWEKSTDY